MDVKKLLVKLEKIEKMLNQQIEQQTSNNNSNIKMDKRAKEKIFDGLLEEYEITFDKLDLKLSFDSELYEVLSQVDNNEDLDDETLSYLEDKLLTPVLGKYYEMKAEKCLDEEKAKWNLVLACSKWRSYSRAIITGGMYENLSFHRDMIIKYHKEHSMMGYFSVEGLESEDKKLMSAIITTRGAALLDISEVWLDKVEMDTIEAVKLNPRAYHPHYLLTRVYRLKGINNKKEEHLKIAQELDPDYQSECTKDFYTYDDIPF